MGKNIKKFFFNAPVSFITAGAARAHHMRAIFKQKCARLTFKKIYDIILKKTIFFRAVSLLTSKLLNAGDFTIDWHFKPHQKIFNKISMRLLLIAVEFSVVLPDGKKRNLVLS